MQLRDPLLKKLFNTLYDEKPFTPDKNRQVIDLITAAEEWRLVKEMEIAKFNELRDRFPALSEIPAPEAIDWNKKDQNGNSLLILAAQNGRSKVVKKLLDLKANVNQQNSRGVTALIAAASAENRNIDIVRYLVEAQADVDIQNDRSRTALILATAANNTDLVHYLVKDAKANVNISGEYSDAALLFAAHNNNSDIVHCLVEAKADINKQGIIDSTTALIFAVKNNNMSMVRCLIEAKADVNKKNEYFKRLGVKRKDTALTVAIEQDNIDMVRYLIDAKADLNNPHGTAFMLAAELGKIDVARHLLEVKMDINQQDTGGDTALLYASMTNQTTMMAYLINAKAKLEITNKKQQTALDSAIAFGNLGTISVLLESGAVIRDPKSLYTMLMEADQCDPAVLWILSILLKQQKNLRNNASQEGVKLEEADYQELMRYESSLTKVTEIYKKETDNVIDTATNISNVIRNIILDYSDEFLLNARREGFFGERARYDRVTPQQVTEAAKEDVEEFTPPPPHR